MRSIPTAPIRHIASIQTALAGDLTNLRLQFDAIETLSYTPPFDHLRDVVIERLDAAAQYVKDQEP